jgi:acetyltransferase-like isoleucine patch superfamily enzyme
MSSEQFLTQEFDYNSLKSFGKGSYISSDVQIKRPQLVVIGDKVAIDSYFYCTVAAEIGDHSHIAPMVSIIGGQRGLFRCAEFCNLAAGTRVICVSDSFAGHGLIGAFIPDEFKDMEIMGPIILERFCNVGSNAIIFPGIRLAEGTVIGAGSIVKQSTEPWTIYAGIPARPIRERPREKMLEFAKAMGY